MSRFVYMGILLLLVALVLLRKSLLPRLFLRLWYLLLPISPPFALFLVHLCLVGFMDGNALLFLFPSQISFHTGLTLGNGLKNSRGS